MVSGHLGLDCPSMEMNSQWPWATHPSILEPLTMHTLLSILGLHWSNMIMYLNGLVWEKPPVKIISSYGGCLKTTVTIWWEEAKFRSCQSSELLKRWRIIEILCNRAGTKERFSDLLTEGYIIRRPCCCLQCEDLSIGISNCEYTIEFYYPFVIL